MIVFVVYHDFRKSLILQIPLVKPNEKAKTSSAILFLDQRFPMLQINFDINEKTLTPKIL